MLFLSVYPGTVITWMPWWMSNGIRVLIWVGSIGGCFVIVKRAVSTRPPPNLAWGRAALFVYMAQQAILTAERWGQPLTYESALSIPALIFVWLALFWEKRREWLT